jgi:hypothetical protein
LVAEELAPPDPVLVLVLVPPAVPELKVLLELLHALAVMAIAAIAARDATLIPRAGCQVLRDFTRFPLPVDGVSPNRRRRAV